MEFGLVGRRRALCFFHNGFTTARGLDNLKLWKSNDEELTEWTSYNNMEHPRSSVVHSTST